MSENSQQERLREVLLEACPFCDYSLEGLPAQHVCPECGHAINRHWRQFGGVAKWGCMNAWMRWTQVALWSVAALFYAGVLVSFCRAWRGNFGIVRCVFAGLLLVTAVSFAYKIRLLFVRPRYAVLVAPTAVHMIDYLNQRFETYPLCEVDKAFVDALHNVCLAMGKPTVRLARFHRGKAEAKRCAEYINALVDKGRKPG